MQTATASPAFLNPVVPSFAGLMELYENNYLRLRRLCPALESLGPCQVSRVARASDLYLEIIERTPYTTQLRLTYRFPETAADAVQREPDLLIRLYHDARQAEVRAGNCRQRSEPFSGAEVAAVPDLLCRWRQNRFLFKWLGFLLYQGHQFPCRYGSALPAAVI